MWIALKKPRNYAIAKTSLDDGGRFAAMHVVVHLIGRWMPGFDGVDDYVNDGVLATSTDNCRSVRPKGLPDSIDIILHAIVLRHCRQ